MGDRTFVYFSEAVFFDPSGTACILLEASAAPSDDISASDPALSSLSTRAVFFAALGFAVDFFTVCFVVTLAPFFCALSDESSEHARPRSPKY